jgi:hypothetical protein
VVLRPEWLEHHLLFYTAGGNDLELYCLVKKGSVPVPRYYPKNKTTSKTTGSQPSPTKTWQT